MPISFKNAVRYGAALTPFAFGSPLLCEQLGLRNADDSYSHKQATPEALKHAREAMDRAAEAERIATSESLNGRFLTAVSRGEMNTVGRLLQNGADVRTCDEEGRGPLHLAARGKAGVSVLEEILAEDPKAAAKPDYDGWLPLHWACQVGHVDAAHYLMGISDPSHRDVRGLNCLHVAAWNGDADIVKMLLDSVHIEVQTNNGATALAYATEKGHKQVMQVLMDRGADPHRSHFQGRSAAALARTQDLRDILGTAKQTRVLKS
jgi:ankyrin repeat protein